MLDIGRLIVSLVASGLIGGLAYRRGSLTATGWLGAIIVGTATAGLGGWLWGALVVVFFVTSSALSHWRRATKADVAADKFSKGERRDLAQTLANGGVATALALLHAFDPSPIGFAAALGALGTVTADTWATELGTLSRSRPRLVTTGAPVDPGTSGGVTLLGTGAAVAGSLLIGLTALIGSRLLGVPSSLAVVTVALIGGVTGAFADSLFGATIQAIKWCPRCGVETERAIHRCGTPTQSLRGWHWFDNDWVNFLSSAVGALVGALTWAALINR